MDIVHARKSCENLPPLAHILKGKICLLNKKRKDKTVINYLEVKLTATGVPRCPFLSLTQSAKIELSVKKQKQSTLGVALETCKTHDPCPLTRIFS